MNMETIGHARHHMDVAGAILHHIHGKDLKPEVVTAASMEANAHISLAMGMLLIDQAEDVAIAEALGGS